MIIKHPAPHHKEGQIALWMEAFQEPKESPETFFATAFSPFRYLHRQPHEQKYAFVPALPRFLSLYAHSPSWQEYENIVPHWSHALTENKFLFFTLYGSSGSTASTGRPPGSF